MEEAFSAAEGDQPEAGDVVHCTSTVGGYKVGIRLRFPIEDDAAG